MSKAMLAEQSNPEKPVLTLRERFDRVQARKKAFQKARFELGNEGAAEAICSDIDSDWPSLIPKYIDLSSCED
jgi:hypothetical protein